MERQESVYQLPDDPFESSEKLIASLMTINARNLSWTRDRIEEGLKAELAGLVAEHRHLVHALIEMCSQPWAPNPLMILNMVEHRVERIERMYEHHCSDLEES